MINLDHLPEYLHYDGVMPGNGCEYLQFTELDRSRKSYGASFYLDSRSANLDAILRRREEKRVEFSGGKK